MNRLEGLTVIAGSDGMGEGKGGREGESSEELGLHFEEDWSECKKLWLRADSVVGLRCLADEGGE